MTRRAAAVLSVLALAGAAGCMMKAAEAPRDTMADLGISAADLKSLTLAVVYSENTKQGLDFQQGAITGQPGFKPEAWFKAMVAELRGRFKRTVVVDRIEDAAASNADLVGVVDDQAEFDRLGAKLSVRMKVIFTTPDKRGVDVIEGRNDPGAIMWTHGSMDAAAKTAQDRFFRSLASSSRLQEFARTAPVSRGDTARVVPASPAVASDLDELPSAAAPRKAYAVVVGVERYRESLPPADFAAGDARLAGEYFKRVLGVPEQNLAVLTDDRATKGDFEKYFERWLPNRVEAGDTVYVYFSGHGAPNPAKGDSYLVPFDGDPTYIDQTGFAVKRLFDDLGKLPAEHVYVAMDSCFSGAGGRSVIARGARPLVSVVQGDVPAKVTVLSASAGDQISSSFRDKGHGLFTYFLLKGLKEKGDLRAAFDYAKPEVVRAARREYNADQEPQWREGR